MSVNRRLPGILFIASFLTGSLVLSSCVEDPTLPVLSTEQAIEITVSSAIISGKVTDDGRAEVTARGICWGVEAEPVLEDNFKASGTGPGEFTCTIEGLNPNTEYHARAYAENSVGIAFGNEVTFTTGIGAPDVTTAQVYGITANSAICGGTVTNNGGAAITEKGVCWSTSPGPDLQDYYTNISTGTVTYTCTLTNLITGTKYYARAYVKNGGGTAYGDQVIFNTKITDIEGNLYVTVNIGTQVWMAENLRVTKFNDNTSIPNVTDNTEWSNLSEAAYSWYNNDISHKPTLGALYNWFTITKGELCPSGWHVPSDSEFNSLEIALGMNPDLVNVWGWRGTDQGKQMKSTTGWDGEGNGTNSSGFNGMAGGYRQGPSGSFWALGLLTYWWTSTDDSENGKPDVSWYRRLDGENDAIYKATTAKRGGKYIRCIRD